MKILEQLILFIPLFESDSKFKLRDSGTEEFNYFRLQKQIRLSSKTYLYFNHD